MSSPRTDDELKGMSEADVLEYIADASPLELRHLLHLPLNIMLKSVALAELDRHETRQINASMRLLARIAVGAAVFALVLAAISMFVALGWRPF